jgi:arabinofuranan 3-O-arabinosyltransferase
MQDAVAFVPRGARFDDSGAVKRIVFALCVANAMFLLAMFMNGLWLVEPGGGGVPTDFVGVWAAGRLVLEGHPAAAYNWTLHKAVEVAAVGHQFEGYYAWFYPPSFLFVAAPLALMPYPTASAFWAFLTFPAYVVAVRQIVAHRIGLFLACAFPAVLSNVVVGQNGFVTAALLGGTLVTMQRRPILAGCLLGLMTYKPHFGILFPLALVAGREWRTFFSAAATATLLAVVSLAAFGIGPWEGFVHNLGVANETVLSLGQADFRKLQSLFGFARSVGVGENLAWSLQIALGIATAIALWAVWRGGLPFALKAAALATGALVATPYLYLYDLVALAIPMAFLVRLGRREGFLAYELAGIAAANALILSFPFVNAPVVLVAVAIVAGLVVRRIIEASAADHAAATRAVGAGESLSA